MQVDWFFHFSAKQLPARTRTFGGSSVVSSSGSIRPRKLHSKIYWKTCMSWAFHPIFNAFEILLSLPFTSFSISTCIRHQQMGGQKLDTLAITVRLLVDVSPMAFYGRDLLVSQCHGRWGHLDCNGWCAETLDCRICRVRGAAAFSVKKS